MAGGDEGVGVKESAPGWVVITALEIIEPGFLVMLVAIEAISGCFDSLGGEPPPGKVCSGYYHQQKGTLAVLMSTVDFYAFKLRWYVWTQIRFANFPDKCRQCKSQYPSL